MQTGCGTRTPMYLHMQTYMQVYRLHVHPELATSHLATPHLLAYQLTKPLSYLHPAHSQALYSSLGYRDTGVLEHPVMPYLHGRPPDRCAFRMKLVPGWGERRREAAAASKEEREAGTEAGEPGAGAEAGALAS